MRKRYAVQEGVRAERLVSLAAPQQAFSAIPGRLQAPLAAPGTAPQGVHAETGALPQEGNADPADQRQRGAGQAVQP